VVAYCSVLEPLLRLALFHIFSNVEVNDIGFVSQEELVFGLHRSLVLLSNQMFKAPVFYDLLLS
jgi:hypothetical protein